MRILILGDTHASRRHVAFAAKIAKDQRCSCIIQLGDWGFTWPGCPNFLTELQDILEAHDMPMLWLDGNHDNYDDLKDRGFWEANDMCPFEDANMVQYIPRGCVWEMDGVSFMALGGAYSIDQDRRVEGQSWWRDELITFADQVRCGVSMDLHGKPIDVFLSHDCPEGVRRLETYLELTTKQFGIDYKMDQASRANRAALRRVVEEARPKRLYHGHYHWAYTDTLHLGDTDVIVTGLAHDGLHEESFAIFDTEHFKKQRGAADNQ